MTDWGAKPMECTTPSSTSTCSPTRSARAARSSSSVTSSCTTGASTGRRLANACVSFAWRPNDESTTWAPSSWASRAAWNAIEESVRTPVTRSFLPSSRPIGFLPSCARWRARWGERTERERGAGAGGRRAGGAGGSVTHAEAAVDRDHGPGDVTGGVGREELHDARDLVGLGEPARGDGGLVGVLALGGELGGHRGVDEPGRHDVRRDAARPELARDRARHADERRLRRRVVHLAGAPVEADDRRHEHDAAAALADHALRHTPDAPEG